MSDEQRKNLLVRNKAYHYPFYAYEDGWVDGRGVAKDGRSWNTTNAYDFSCELTAGTYTLIAECDGSDTLFDESVRIGNVGGAFYATYFPASAGVTQPCTFEVTDETAGTWYVVGKRRGARWRAALFAGTEPGAWAPYSGEDIAGVGGCSMSANLLDGATVVRGTKDGDGYFVLSQNGGTDKHDSPIWSIDGQAALAENQTMHMACSVMPEADWPANACWASVEYMDSAGNFNWAQVDFASPAKSGTWTRLETSATIPSGMRVTKLVVSNAYKNSSGAKLASPTLSYGSPVTLASDAHTPYATQDHVAAEYATKAALKVTSDAVTAEVTERGKLAGKVGTLESTSGTHTSKLQQLAASITSLVRGESTYTDPDGASATSGIYSLVEQTRDSVTALFGSYTKTADMQSQIATAKSQATSAANSATDSKLASYTKTADLASTQAVKDAKKAGTDAQAAASAAQTTADSAKSTAQAAASDAATAKTNAASAVSTANSASTSAANAVETANAASSTASSASSTANSAVSTANAAKTSAASAVSTANAASSTAGAAKSTADSLATLIRADSTGITVGKSADGETYSTGRTHMTDSAFQVLDKAGAVIAQLAGDGVSFLAGLVRIVGGTGILPGNKTANFIRVDAGSGVVGLSGIISRLDAAISGIAASVSAGWEQDFGYGVTAVVRESNTVSSAAYLAKDKSELHVGDNHVTMTPEGFELSRPSALRAAVGSYGPVSPSSPYGSLTFCVRAGVATLWVSWGTTADSWGKAQCGEWVIPEAYRPRMDLNAPVALASRGTGDTGDTRLVVEASTGKIYWQNLGGGHSATTFDALVSWGIE